MTDHFPDPARRHQTADHIQNVEVQEFVLPLPKPVRNGTALINERGYVAVTVTTVDGTEGTAVAFTRNTPLAGLLRDYVAPQLIGRVADDIEAIAQDLLRAGERFFGRSGLFPRATSLIDIALWDLRGRARGLSVAELLGAPATSVPVLMALGYYRSGNELQLLQKEYATLVDRGFKRFKMMAGGASVDRDMERVHAVVEVLPADATLAIDVNGAWESADEAREFLDRLPIELDFIEDPFRPDDLASLHDLRSNSDTSIAVGEWESGLPRFADLIQQDLLDVVRIDATAAGGITGWLQIADLATDHGKRIIPHYYPEIHVHVAAATPAAEAIEVVPALTGADNFDELFTSTSWTEQPLTLPGNGVGIGVNWNQIVATRPSASEPRSAAHHPASRKNHRRHERS